MDKLPLSQLIRLGAKLRPKAFGWSMNKYGYTCALGAAYMAKFGEEPKTSISCITALGLNDQLTDEIITMNDDLRMTREKIADHLEQQGL